MLKVSNVTKRFGRMTAVDSVSLEVSKGEIRGLIGPNGSGKSTLFGLISGFHRATSGSIQFGGDEITGLRPHRIARLGLVRTFQLTSVYGELTVHENIEMGHHLAHSRRGGTAGSATDAAPPVGARVEAILDFMGLAPFRGTRASLLPGGTRRVLSIATALAADPRMLLLDEPLAGLDRTEKAAIGRRILDLRDRGVTIVLVEHDVRSIINLCDRVTVLNFGAVIAEDSADGITQNERVIEAYLGRGGRPDA